MTKKTTKIKKTEQPDEPKKLGRPPEAVPEDKAEAICEWISQGKTLRQWCRDNKIHYSTVYLWLHKDESFSQRFTRAREIGADNIADEALALIDEEPTRNANGSIDNGFVNWKRAQAELRLKILAKWFPQKYGDKLDLNHGGDFTLVVTTGVPDADETKKAR